MFNKTREKKRNWISPWADAAKNFKRSGRLASALTTLLMAVVPLAAFGQARAQAIANAYQFVNVVDNTQGFSSFGLAPAINNDSAVAFRSAGTGFESGSVWKWYDGRLTLIATSANNSILGGFGEVVAINSFRTVGFSARVLSGAGSFFDSIIATGDGGALNTIVSANGTGLAGGQFLGIGAMNEPGDVVFLGLRRGVRSQAIYLGNGGPLTAIIDTATDPNFAALGNADINASGKIVFRGVLADGNEGIFLGGRGGIRDIIDTNNPSFFGFLDPVINNRGTVGSAAGLSVDGMAAFTGDSLGITPRSNSSSFSIVDNVAINNQGDIAFFATETVGRDGIFVELTGGSNAVPVIQTGDALFGSAVVALSTGRFSLNDSGRITFRYQLADGRAGIAVAAPRD